jgi:uncharacterized protein involved in copper resistance
MKMKVITQISAIIVLAAIGSVPAASQPQHEHGSPAAQKADQMKPGHMNMPQMDAAHMQQIAEKKKANTERLNTLAAQLKESTGEKKMAVMSEMIGILVGERAAMAEQCAAMHAMMEK